MQPFQSMRNEIKKITYLISQKELCLEGNDCWQHHQNQTLKIEYQISMISFQPQSSHLIFNGQGNK